MVLQMCPSEYIFMVGQWSERDTPVQFSKIPIARLWTWIELTSVLQQYKEWQWSSPGVAEAQKMMKNQKNKIKIKTVPAVDTFHCF